MTVRWIASIAVVVVVAAAAVTIAITWDRTSPPSPLFGRLPDPDPGSGEAQALPREPTPLPERIAIPAQAVPLSAKRLHRALALLSSHGTVWVLGDDSVVRLFDTVQLGPVADKEGNAHSPASSMSLSPDGRRAAFPQPDRVLVVNLVEQGFSDMRVPGPNEWAGWQGESVVVVQAESTWLAKPSNGRVSQAPFSGLNAAFDHGPATEVYEVAGGSSLNRWAAGASQTIELQGVTLDQWRNPMWRNGNRIAVVDGGLADTRRLSVLTVDGTRATLTHRLVLTGPEPTAADATVLGWLTEHKLLIRHEGWILAWDLPTDAITRVSAVDGDLTVSLPRLST